MGKMGASYICNHTIICHCGSPRLPPAVCLVKGLADKHCDWSLAFHRDFPCKIKFVCGGSGKRKSAQCGLQYPVNDFCTLGVIDIMQLFTLPSLGSTLPVHLQILLSVVRFVQVGHQVMPRVHNSIKTKCIKCRDSFTTYNNYNK